MKSLLKEAAKEIRPSNFLDYRAYLQSLYAFLKAKSTTYSYRQFSADLGFTASTLIHQIIKGYRPLTVKTAEKIIKQLGIVGSERRYFLTLIEYANGKKSQEREDNFAKLIAIKNELLPEEMDKKWLQYFSEWYHPVIREMVVIESFQDDPKWIAQKIIPNIRPEQAAKSLALLQELKLISKDPAKDRYTHTTRRISTGHRIKGMAIVRYHQKLIELGKESLTRIKGKKRDISGMTLCVDEKTFEKIRSLIHEFQERILAESECDESADRIIQVNIQLFPFTD